MLIERRIEEEVAKTLQAFDDDTVLGENSFLFTRVIAERESRAGKNRYWSAVRTSLKVAALFILILVNLATFLYYQGSVKHDLKEKLVSELREEFQIEQSQENF